MLAEHELCGLSISSMHSSQHSPKVVLLCFVFAPSFSFQDEIGFYFIYFFGGLYFTLSYLMISVVLSVYLTPAF